MKILIASLVSLLFSGSAVIFGLDKIVGLNFYVYFASFLSLNYLFYKVKFKTEKRFRFFIFRNYLTAKNALNKVNSRLKYAPDTDQVLPIQDKAVRLWKLCLKDESAQISCSMAERIRQIEKDNMLIILSPLNEMDYLMTIMDVDNNKSCLYEIRMGHKISESITSTFDIENEKRMKMGQSEKRDSIHNDLNKLIHQQESSLKSKK